MDDRERRTRHPAETEPRGGLAATDRFAPMQTESSPGARRRRRLPNARCFGGRVDEEVAHPHPSQTRMCRFPASGSSWESLARGGADGTIRDSAAKKDSSCQFSYPLSFRGQVCETQSSLPCFPSTVLSARHPASLDRV